jgi:protein-S-isoprenylcysteine O-methyltransferase Ste14
VDTGNYLLILFLGAVVVVVDGQVILRTGPTYLSEVYNQQPARKVTMLVTVFYHLVMLGVVALLASLDLGPEPTVPDIVRRLGFILLATAAGHIVAVLGLSRLRQEQQTTELVEEQLHHRERPTRPTKPTTPG